MRAIVLSLLFIVASQLAHSKGKEYEPAYYLISDTVNHDLAKSEAKFHFNVSNYVSEMEQLKIAVNGTWRTITLDKSNNFELMVQPGKFKFELYLSGEYKEIKTYVINISAQHVKSFRINFQSTEIYNVVEKPVIYCYAPIDTPLEINVEPTGDIVFTYPHTEGKWLGVVRSTGGIEIDGVNYPYLFWEAKTEQLSQQINWSGSEVVSGSTALSYLERISGQLGLNSKEKTDFITYWGPRLASLEHAEVKVLQTTDAVLFGDLSVSDASFKIERIYLVFRPSTQDEQTIVRPQQKITAIKRSEKMILEWGGAQLPAENSNSF